MPIFAPPPPPPPPPAQPWTDQHRYDLKAGTIDALFRVDAVFAVPVLERIADDPSRRIAYAARERLATIASEAERPVGCR